MAIYVEIWNLQSIFYDVEAKISRKG